MSISKELTATFNWRISVMVAARRESSPRRSNDGTITDASTTRITITNNNSINVNARRNSLPLITCSFQTWP